MLPPFTDRPAVFELLRICTPWPRRAASRSPQLVRGAPPLLRGPLHPPLLLALGAVAHGPSSSDPSSLPHGCGCTCWNSWTLRPLRSSRSVRGWRSGWTGRPGRWRRGRRAGKAPVSPCLHLQPRRVPSASTELGLLLGLCRRGPRASAASGDREDRVPEWLTLALVSQFCFRSLYLMPFCSFRGLFLT